MKTRAVSMVLLMIASALAGCTSGDPDGDGELGIDSDVLNQMIEDNLQDFINNSSVTVHQTVHYHNNTTVNHHYHNNTTVNEGNDITENNFQTDYTNYTLGQISNSSGSSDEILFVRHMEFNAEELAPDLVPRQDTDPRDLFYIYTKNFWGYTWVDTSGGNNSSGYYEQTLITITHQVPCSVFYTFENGGGSEYGIYNANFWEDRWAYEYYFREVYGYNDSDSNAGMTGNDYYSAGQQSTDFCYPEWNPWLAERLVVNIGNISIPQGYMITVNAIEYYHVWGNTTGSVVGNSTQQTHEGGSTSELLHSEYYDHMIFTKESGGISVNSLSYYGGWDTLELDIHLHLARFWESSDVTLTILYSFTPVIPVE